MAPDDDAGRPALTRLLARAWHALWSDPPPIFPLTDDEELRIEAHWAETERGHDLDGERGT